MLVAQQGSVHPGFCRFGPTLVCSCGYCRLNPLDNENGEGVSSLRGKAKAMYPSMAEDEFVGEMSTEGLHLELDILWRTASAAQRNRNGRHKFPLSRFGTNSSQGGSQDHGSQRVRWPYAVEAYDNFLVELDQDQRTQRVSQSLPYEDIHNVQHENEPASQPERLSTVIHNGTEPWHWEARRDQTSDGMDSVAPEMMLPREESDSDDEILIPSTRDGWRDRETRGIDAPQARILEDQRLARDPRAVRWAEEAAVSEKYVVFGSNLVSCAAGLDIREIVPGFELCSLKVKNLPAGASVAEVGDIISQQGVPTSDFFVAQVYNTGSTSEAVVLIARHQPIGFEPEGIGFRRQFLSFDVSDFKPPNSMIFNEQTPALSVKWEILNEPLIVTYYSPEEALRRAGELNGMYWKGRRLRVSVIESHPRASHLHSLKITNPPAYAETDFEFCCFVGTLLVQPLRGTSCGYLESLSIVSDRLRQQKGVLMHTLEVFLVDGDGQATVQVNFDSWESVRHAYTTIQDSRPGFGNQYPKLRAWRPYPFHYSTNIPQRQYFAQKRLWDAIREGKDDPHEEGAGILIEEADGTVLVIVLGDDQKATGSLKVRVESLVAGEELDMACWHPNFLVPHESEPLFDRVYAETGVFARTDIETHSLRVHGEPGRVQYARRLIEEEVQRLQNIATTVHLHRATVAFFVREGIGRLKELIGEENAVLDVASRPCTIMVKGGQEALRHLERLIEESSSNDFLPVIGEDTVCPVCYTTPSNPEYLGCGHSYCAGCLKHLLSSAADSKKFPIVCLGDEATCHSPFPIPFLRRFLPHQTFQHLIGAAFTCYTERHPQEYRCCPTVDCKQVYRRQQHATSLQCPSCLLSICPACSEESHGILTCEESHFQRDPVMQELVNEQLGFKKCPSCRAWIEKSGGCNHMRCPCGADICWRCMSVFSGTNIYAHMNSPQCRMHGEGLPPDHDVGADPAGDLIAQRANAFEMRRTEMERGEAAGLLRGVRVDFFGQLQPARHLRYGMLHPDDDLVMMERRGSPPPWGQVPRRHLIPQLQPLHAQWLH